MPTRGERTRRRLLDAGTEVFARKGFHATRVDDIVQVARTSHGTFYLYFANKEALFASIVTGVGDELQALAATLDGLGPGPGGQEALTTWIAGFSHFYARYGPIIRAWTEAETGNEELGRLGTDVLGRFTASVTDRVATIAPEGLDPSVASLAIVAMLERLHYYVAAGQVRAERAQMVRTLARVTHHALFGPAGDDSDGNGDGRTSGPRGRGRR